MGIRPLKCWISAALTPDSRGVQGPGEITSRDGRNASASSTVIWSFRTTSIRRNRSSSPKRWTRLKVKLS